MNTAFSFQNFVWPNSRTIGDNSTKLQASFIVYAGDDLFQSARIRDSQEKNGSRVEVVGSVVSLTVQDVELVNLTDPVVIEFKVRGCLFLVA